MSSDSEFEEFFDAEDVTPKQSFLDELPETRTSSKLDEEERQLLALKHLQEERRRQEDEALQKRLLELEEKKEEERKKQMVIEMKAKEADSRRRKLDEMRQQMSFDAKTPIVTVSPPRIDLTIDEVDGSTIHVDTSPVDNSRYQDQLKFSDYSNNINSSHPEKDNAIKYIPEITCSVKVPDSEALVDEVLQSVCDDENEPDIVRSSKPRTPPNTLLHATSPPGPVINKPVAPPRKKKKDRIWSTSTDEGSITTCSSPEVDPVSPGLPSMNPSQLTPLSSMKCLVKDLEYSLDLRSALGGRRHIKAEDAEADAVNSDLESPGNDSKTSSLDRHSIAGENRSRDKDKECGDQAASTSPSTNPMSDKEILESVYVLNLDTGEKVQLIDVEDKLPQGINPLNLHLLRRTKEFSSTGKLNSDELDGDDKSESGKSSSLEKGAKQKATKLRKFIGKRVGKTVHKVKSVADQVFYGDDPGIEEEVSVDGRKFKIKASHNNKGPYDFAQPQMLQELGGEHTGAVWTVKFSPCGRLLTTGGQDSVLRVWILKSAFSYFDDMRHKYADVKVSPAPSHESLNTMSSEASAFESSVPAMFEDDENAPFMSRPFCKYHGHTADVLDISWSKNYFILSSSMDKTVRLWHISHRECLCTFQHIDFVTAIVFHPRDDRYFLSGSLDGKVRLWNIPDKKVTLWNEIVGPSNLITTANFCHNGKYAVVGTYDGKCIFFSTEQLKYFTQIHVRSTRGKNAKGRKITGIEPLPGEDKVLVTSNDSRIRLYDLRDLTLTCKYKGCSNNSSQIRASFSPKGKYIVCGSEDHFTYVWKTHHDYYKFSSARRDRNDYWEAFKVHNAVVTAAIFAPYPSLLQHGEESSATPKDSQENQGEIIITADFTGVIKIVQNKKT